MRTVNKYVRKGVNFNVDSEYQRKLLEWITRKSNGNFSGFIKTVMYVAMTAELKQQRERSDSTADD